MSTLSISPAFETAVLARPRLTRASTVRLTRRGRIVILLGFLAAAFVVMVAFGGWATATLDSGTPDKVRVIEVQPGDTLYDLAARVTTDGDVNAMVEQIEDLNHLDSSVVYAGQKLRVPVA